MQARAVAVLFGIALAALAAAGAVSMWFGEGPPPAAVSEVRLVSLSPSVTETLAVLGASDLQVARSAWCNWPPEVQDLPIVGSGLTPDYEAIVAARPSHILVEASGSAPVEDLRALAITEALPWLTLEEVTGSVVRIGELTGRQAKADKLVGRLQERLAVPEAGPSAPTVLLVLGGDGLGERPPWFIKKNSLHGMALNALGVRNAVPEEVAGAPTLSIERLIQLDPDVIVVLIPGQPDAAARQRAMHAFDHLEPLRAPREGRVAALGSARLLTTGPGILDYVDELEQTLRPLGVLE
ncbi:MAG: iron complex transport system substrate-binding protein [Kiritimatiellia bacterium]